jgi:Flp pilus assembly protein TadG
MRILKLKSDRGQALVELAFVLPLVLLLLFGIIDFGLAYNTKNSDTNLANLAARSLSVLGPTGVESCGGVATEPTVLAWMDCVAAANGETKPNVACVQDTSTTTYAAGDALEVEIKTPFSWFGVLGENGGFGTTISASATNRIEVSMTSSGGTLNPLITASSPPNCTF